MELLKQTALVIVLCGLFFVGLDYISSLPVVHEDQYTGQCIGVSTYYGVLFDSLGSSCEDLPLFYFTTDYYVPAPESSVRF